MTSDFLVASRSVPSRLNAGAISGEYLSAASFLGIAGLILVDGADALWYPVGYTAGYLALLLFVAAPLRRSGAYTVPGLRRRPARARRVLRKVCTAFVLVIGWLYLLPQLQGAGLTVRHRDRSAAVDRLGGGRRDRGRDGGARRHALGDVRPGVPVLAQAHRARHPGRDRARGPVRHRPHVRPGRAAAVPATRPRCRCRHRSCSRCASPSTSSPAARSTGSRPTAAERWVAGSEHTVAAGHRAGLPQPARRCRSPAARRPTTRAGCSPFGGSEPHQLLATYSLILATFLGTMGLPHVLGRFYTNSDGRAARRSAVVVLAMLGAFYLLVTLLGVLSRFYTPELLVSGAQRRRGAAAADGRAGFRRRRGGRRRHRRGRGVGGVPVHLVGSAGEPGQRRGHRHDAAPGAGRRADGFPLATVLAGVLPVAASR